MATMVFTHPKIEPRAFVFLPNRILLVWRAGSSPPSSPEQRRAHARGAPAILSTSGSSETNSGGSSLPRETKQALRIRSPRSRGMRAKRG
jgi:hypothetical protein